MTCQTHTAGRLRLVANAEEQRTTNYGHRLVARIATNSAIVYEDPAGPPGSFGEHARLPTLPSGLSSGNPCEVRALLANPHRNHPLPPHPTHRLHRAASSRSHSLLRLVVNVLRTCFVLSYPCAFFVSFCTFLWTARPEPAVVALRLGGTVPPPERLGAPSSGRPSF